MLIGKREHERVIENGFDLIKTNPVLSKVLSSFVSSHSNIKCISLENILPIRRQQELGCPVNC
jgi:hypothetical protein